MSSRVARVAIKSAYLIAACAGLALAATQFPVTIGLASARTVAREVVRGYNYPTSTIRTFLAATESSEVCDADRTRLRAILSLRFADLSIRAGPVENLDAILLQLDQAIVFQLRCAPTDSFFWFALYWERNVANGNLEANLPLLVRSYETGPHELWIARKRNPMAMAVLDHGDTGFRGRVLAELCELLLARQFDVVARVVQGYGITRKEQISAQFAKLPQQPLTEFSEYLSRNGPSDFQVPGVVNQDGRPKWIK